MTVSKQTLDLQNRLEQASFAANDQSLNPGEFDGEAKGGTIAAVYNLVTKYPVPENAYGAINIRRSFENLGTALKTIGKSLSIIAHPPSAEATWQKLIGVDPVFGKHKAVIANAIPPYSKDLQYVIIANGLVGAEQVAPPTDWRSRLIVTAVGPTLVPIGPATTATVAPPVVEKNFPWVPLGIVASVIGAVLLLRK